MWVGGSTSSTNYPVVHAYQKTYAGGPFDAFLSRISLSPIDSIAVLKAAIGNLAAAKEISEKLNEELATELDRAEKALQSNNNEAAHKALDRFEFLLLRAAWEGRLSAVNAKRLAVAGWDLQSLIA